jgi:alkylhydroperoxidase family enzyme
VTEEQIAALKEPGGRYTDVFAPEEQALLRFTDLLTSLPGNVDRSDLEALATHFDAEQTIELVIIIAVANFTNRINDGLQTPIS